MEGEGMRTEGKGNERGEGVNRKGERKRRQREILGRAGGG